MKRWTVSIAAVLVLLAASMASASTEEEGVVLRVGLRQPWTSLNVAAGFEVAEYEIWNLHYATLTDKAADDFSTIEGLAESWEASDDGLTYTYTLREGLLWSDDTPLTAEDIAWTINTSRDQGWLNHVATTGNLDAVAIDDRTVEITSSVPDPKLPTMDVYIVPKHIWEPIAPDGEAVTSYEALDGVGSGPFVIVPETRGMEQQILSGEIPDPKRIPSGCRFHPRCPVLQSGESDRLGIADRCRGEDPAILGAEAIRDAACWAVPILA